MIRNIFEMVFWCAAIVTTVGLYMNALENAEIETVSSHEIATQLVKSD